jgi:multidrug efflux pump subunit AcrA (membrane-fusion protein)
MKNSSVLFLLSLAVACPALGVPASGFAQVEKPKPPAIVFVNRIKPAELFDSLTYPARVSSQVNTTLLAETEGVVTRILAPLGRKVSRGQKILTITHTDPVYQYAPAAILSPVSGVVSLIDVTEGTQVSKGQKIGAVTDPSRISISIEIPAQDLASVRHDLVGEFRAPGQAEPVPVRIRGISPYVDPATGTAACEIAVDPGKKPQANLAPGLLGQVTFKVGVHQGISVPEHALVYKGNDPFLRVVEAGKAKKVAVRLGSRRQGLVEVLEGLGAGAVVVERASRFIADGESVTVQESP